MRTVLKIGVGVLAGVTAFGLGFGTCYFLGMGKTTTTESTEGKNVNVSPVEDKSTEVAKEVPASIANDLVENIKEVYSTYYSSDYINNLKSIDPDKVLYLAIISNQRMYDEPVSFEDVKKYITKYFGDNYNYTDHDIICKVDNKVLYKADTSINQYTFSGMHGHDSGNGYVFSRNNYVKVLSSQYDGNNIVINTKILYGLRCGGGTCAPVNSYYKDPNDTQLLLGNYSLDQNYVVTESDYESVKDKLDTTVFTFSRNSDGSYYLSDVKVKQD